MFIRRALAWKIVAIGSRLARWLGALFLFVVHRRIRLEGLQKRLPSLLTEVNHLKRHLAFSLLIPWAIDVPYAQA